jgi:CDP-2,3-bis-(O-geranylgeranyl)-sn-glycerol synthase
MILESIYFLFPAYFANMAPVIAMKLKILKKLDKPLDHNMKINNKPFFGRNKTYRGLVSGLILSIVISYVQAYLLKFPYFKALSIIDYSNPFFLGIALGLGAIVGDSLASTLKRQLSIDPGKKFIPLDQIDFVLGAFLFTYLFSFHIEWVIVIYGLVVTFFLHILVNHLSFYAGIRKEKW